MVQASQKDHLEMVELVHVMRRDTELILRKVLRIDFTREKDDKKQDGKTRAKESEKYWTDAGGEMDRAAWSRKIIPATQHDRRWTGRHGVERSYRQPNMTGDGQGGME